MAVHSTQLGAAAGVTNSGVTLYTVPSGYRTILKGLWIRNDTAAANVAEVALVTGAGTIAFLIPLPASPTAGSTTFLSLWVVLNAGDELKFLSAPSTTADVIASGAQLSLTGP